MASPRRIGILASAFGWPGGINYVSSTVRALRALKTAGRRSDFSIVLALNSADRERLDASVLEAADERVANDIHDAPRSLAANLHSAIEWRRPHPAAARLGRFAALHRLDFVFPARYGPRRPQRTIAVDWIPDFGHVTHPDSYGEEECRRRDESFADSAASADRVLLSSEDAARHFRAIYPGHAEKAQVYQFRASFPALGDESPHEVQRRYNLPEKFAIVCNQTWKDKRHADVFEAVARLQDRIPDLAIVCTGALSDYRNPQHVDHLLALIQTLGVHQRVFLLGSLPRRDQVQLLRRAAFLIQASYCEGWNTGVEEARALGKRVLLSDIPVHKEQAWNDCRLFKVCDVPALAGGLEELWRDSVPGPGAAEQGARQAAEVLQIAAAERFLEGIGFNLP